MTTLHKLDRLYQLDWRSLNHTVGSALMEAGEPVYRPRSYAWAIDEYLDQGTEGACVGFSFSHELAARPQEVNGITNTFARNLYFDAQRADSWAGGAYPGASPFYEGTSVLAGAQVLKNRGYYSAYKWALSVEETAQGVGYFGPAVLGINWYAGMDVPDSKGFIHPTGNIRGGHAICAQAQNVVFKPFTSWTNRTWADVDLQKSHLVLQNSWGQGWGLRGRCRLSFNDLQILLGQQADICFPVRTTKITV